MRNHLIILAAFFLILCVNATGHSAEYPWYFLHITDPHCFVEKGLEAHPLDSPAMRKWQSLLEQIATFDPPPRFVLCTGDLVNVSAGNVGVRNFEALLSTLSGDIGAQEYYVDEGLTIPIYFCPGNHEAKNSSMLNDTFDNYHRLIKMESYYSIFGDDFAIFSLNSGKDEFNDAHWLLPEGDGLYEADVQGFLEDLAAAGDSLCKVVMVHHPYVNPEADFIGDPWNDWVDGTFMHFREEFIAACHEYEVDVILSGHYDLGVRFRNDGIWDQSGSAWEEGDGTVFVMTNGIQLLNVYRKLTVISPGEVQVGPVEPFQSPEAGGVPLTVKLQQNRPNPFNTRTAIGFGLPYTSRVRLDVYNILGQRIDTLVDGVLGGGQHAVSWDGRDSGGQEVAAGIYFYRLTAGDVAETRKMVLVK